MLQQTDPSKLLAPNYKLVVRGADSIISEVNQTAPSFDCHYTGQIEGLEFSKVAFSICDNKLVSMVFIFMTTDWSLLLGIQTITFFGKLEKDTRNPAVVVEWLGGCFIVHSMAHAKI